MFMELLDVVDKTVLKTEIEIKLPPSFFQQYQNIENDPYTLCISLHHPKENTVFQDIFKDFNKKEILERITKFSLSERVKFFAKEYGRIFGKRDVFLWKFLGCLFKETGITLSSVDRKLLDSTVDNKIILTILLVILDDVADCNHDKELLNKFYKVLCNDPKIFGNERDEEILLLRRLWHYLMSEFCNYPRFDELKNIFMFDFQQVVNALEYSCIINNHPNIINIYEMERYDTHNMLVFLYNGIDLMASPNLDIGDFPFLRTAFSYAENMARVGNWLSTWKRELNENDISSGVIAYAISNKIFEIDDFKKLTMNEIIDRIENCGYYEHFFDVWMQNYNGLVSLKDRVESIDMESYISGLKEVLRFHLATEGLK